MLLSRDSSKSPATSWDSFATMGPKGSSGSIPMDSKTPRIWLGILLAAAAGCSRAPEAHRIRPMAPPPVPSQLMPAAPAPESHWVLVWQHSSFDDVDPVSAKQPAPIHFSTSSPLAELAWHADRPRYWN